MLNALLMAAEKLRVEERDRLTFEVTEVASGKKFIVDLTALKVRGTCNGQCDCWSFKGSRNHHGMQERLEKGMGPSSATRCNHIQACRDYVASRLIDHISEKWQDDGGTQ